LFCVGSDLFEPNSFPSILLYRPNLWPKRSSSYRQGPVKRTMVEPHSLIWSIFSLFSVKLAARLLFTIGNVAKIVGG
jgi:hypothetical protein